jgi:signal transduction histidine kinase
MTLKRGILILSLILGNHAFSSVLLADNIVPNREDVTAMEKQIDSLLNVSEIKFGLEEYVESIQGYQEAAFLCENHPVNYRYFDAFLGLGRAYYRINNYSKAQEYLFQSLEQFSETIPLEKKGKTYSVLASTFYNMGDYNSSHEYKLKSIKINELLKDTSAISSDYYDLGSLFYYQEMLDKAIEYYNKSQEFAFKSGNKRIIYNSIAALGATYEKKGELEISSTLNWRSLELADSLNYLTGKAYSLHNIGTNFIETGEFKKAIQYLNQSLEIKEELGDQWGIVGSNLALSKLYIQNKRYQLAEQNLKNALKIAEGLGSKIRLSEIYKGLSNLYRESGDKDLTIKYLTSFLDLKDSILNETILKEMGDRKSQFEIQKKEYEIELLKKDMALLESEKKVQQLNTTMAFALSAFLLVVCLAFYLLLIKQRKLSSSLKEKNNEIEAQNQKIESQNKLLESSNEELKQFAYVASHDLREPLRMIRSYGTLISRRYKELLDESGKEFLDFMTDAAQRMDKLLLDLLDYSRTSRNLDSFEEVSTRDLLTSIEVMTGNLLREQDAEINYDPEKFPIVMGRKTQLFQLFQNLITNALKYNTQLKPEVKIDCQKNCENYIFSFQDNGIGISQKDQEKIFEMFHRLHSNAEYEGSGIGLATCKKIVAAHGGDIWVDSELEKGSTFYFSLPISSITPTEKNDFPKLVPLEN